MLIYILDGYTRTHTAHTHIAATRTLLRCFIRQAKGMGPKYLGLGVSEQDIRYVQGACIQYFSAASIFTSMPVHACLCEGWYQYHRMPVLQYLCQRITVRATLSATVHVHVLAYASARMLVRQYLYANTNASNPTPSSAPVRGC